LKPDEASGIAAEAGDTEHTKQDGTSDDNEVNPKEDEVDQDEVDVDADLDVEKASGDDQDEVDVDAVDPDTVEGEDPVTDEQEDPTTWSLFRSKWSCCGCVRGADKTRTQKALNFLNAFWWYCAAFFCLWIVVVNIGATVQGDGVRANLPGVYDALYRYIDEGPVCAFDNRGADSNITTFSDKDAAHEAVFLFYTVVLAALALIGTTSVLSIPLGTTLRKNRLAVRESRRLVDLRM